MGDVPDITFHVKDSGIGRAFVHLGDKVRTVTEAVVGRLPDQIRSVLVAEFGLADEDARQVASDALSAQASSAALPDHVALLQEQLAECQAEAGKWQSDAEARWREIAALSAELEKAKADCEAFATSNASLTTAINALHEAQASQDTPRESASGAVAAADGTDEPDAQRTDATPPRQQRGSVQTAAGETPSPPASPLPQADTGAAPNQAATGGEQGAT